MSLSKHSFFLGLLAGFLAAAALAGEKPLSAVEKLERRLAELVNRDRAKHDRPPLRYHTGAAAVARAHSQDMLDHGFFAHESPRTGKVLDRVTRAGIPNRGVAENLANANSIEASEFALMNSPGHRANILNEAFTHIGIGIVLRPSGWPLVTQVFLREVVVRDPAAVRKAILDGIAAERRKRGLRRLVEDKLLTQFAQAHSDHAEDVGKAEPLWLDDLMRHDHRRWRVHEAQYLLTDKESDAILSETALSPRYDHFGLGIAITSPTSKEAGAMWITFIAGQKR